MMSIPSGTHANVEFTHTHQPDVALVTEQGLSDQSNDPPLNP
jgi:hypothetical protein